MSSMEAALAECRSSEHLNYAVIARKHNVNRSTLTRRFKVEIALKELNGENDRLLNEGDDYQDTRTHTETIFEQLRAEGQTETLVFTPTKFKRFKEIHQEMEQEQVNKQLDKDQQVAKKAAEAAAKNEADMEIKQEAGRLAKQTSDAVDLTSKKHKTASSKVSKPKVPAKKRSAAKQPAVLPPPPPAAIRGKTRSGRVVKQPRHLQS